MYNIPGSLLSPISFHLFHWDRNYVQYVINKLMCKKVKSFTQCYTTINWQS